MKKAISSSDISGQIALQWRRKALPLSRRLDFGKPRHEINGSAPFNDVRWAEKLHEFADEVRIIKLIHIISIPCKPVFKVIESRHNSANNFLKQLLAIGLEEFIDIIFGKFFFAAVFISDVSLTVVVTFLEAVALATLQYSARNLAGSMSTDVVNPLAKF